MPVDFGNYRSYQDKVRFGTWRSRLVLACKPCHGRVSISIVPGAEDSPIAVSANSPWIWPPYYLQGRQELM